VRKEYAGLMLGRQMAIGAEPIQESVQFFVQRSVGMLGRHGALKAMNEPVMSLTGNRFSPSASDAW